MFGAAIAPWVMRQSTIFPSISGSTCMSLSMACCLATITADLYNAYVSVLATELRFNCLKAQGHHHG